jgi:multidrug efflux pump
VLGQLPKEVDPPQIVKSDSSAEPVMDLSFDSDRMTPLEVTDYAERYIVDRLSTVPGVSRAALTGGRRAAMRIWLDRQALAARSLTAVDVENALRRENVQLPAGRLESRTRRVSLRTEIGLDTEEDFRRLVIGRSADGRVTRLGDVAEIRIGPESDRSLLRTNGRAGVGIGIEAQSKANVLEVVRGVRQEVDRLHAIAERRIAGHQRR